MLIGILTKTRNINYLQNEIKLIMKKHNLTKEGIIKVNGEMITFRNGTVIRTLTPFLSERGVKCDEIYVKRHIKIEDISRFINYRDYEVIII